VITEPAPHLHSQVLNTLKSEYALSDDERRRTGAFHVSELVYCLSRSYWNRIDPLPPSDDETLLWSLGYGYERVLISRLHMEPIVVDGIIGTPDFAFPDGTPADLKTTRMAPTTSLGCAICGEKRNGHPGRAKAGHPYTKSEPVPFVMPEGWVRQFKSYRYMLNRGVIWMSTDPRWTFGVVVVHLIQPDIRAYLLHFSEPELFAHWQWMLERSNTLESMLAAQDPQPFIHQMDFECDHCSRKLDCQLAQSLQGGK